MKKFKSVQKMYALVCGCRKATVDRDCVKKIRCALHSSSYPASTFHELHHKLIPIKLCCKTF